MGEASPCRPLPDLTLLILSLTQGMRKVAQRKLQATAPPQQREQRPNLYDEDDRDGQVEHEVSGANARSCRPLPSGHQPRHALLKRQEPGVYQGTRTIDVLQDDDAPVPVRHEDHARMEV